MQNYMRGLLMTKSLSNHADSMRFYASDFLAKLPEDFDLLEIGLAWLCSVARWPISAKSVTLICLRKRGGDR